MWRTLGRAIVGVLVFLSIGECLIRIEQTGIFFAATGTERVRADVLPDEELQALDRAAAAASPDDVRIMVLGDSKLRGLGVDARDIASVQLQTILERDVATPRGRIHVLNLSRAGNNTLQNKLTFLKYYRRFNPQIVIFGYNIDDVYGNNRDDSPAGPTSAPSTPQPRANGVPHARRTVGDVARNVVSGVRRVLFHSQVLQFSLSKFNMELKLAGIVVPGTEFYHLVHASHRSDYEGWVESQHHLQQIIDVCHRERIALVVYVVPQLEMLPHFSVFDDVDGTVEQFFRARGIRTINGVTPFMHSDPAAYAISRYDGHPNAKAHALIAQQWAQELEPLIREMRVGSTRTGLRGASSTGDLPWDRPLRAATIVRD
jgi:hypothetical protein